MSSLWFARWPNGEVLLLRADDEDEVRMMLDEAADPGAAKIEEYEGPLALVLTPKLPGREVGKPDYCRPKGAPPAPDALRRRLWEQQQQGQLCDVTLQAEDGATRHAHRVVLCAACPALEAAREGKKTRRTKAAPPGVPTGPILDVVLRWAYLQEANFQHAGPEEVLPVAQQLELEELAAECDYAMAGRLAEHFRYRFHGPSAAGLELALKTLQTADRHARPRLARCVLASLPGDCWRELQGLPAFKELPPAQAAAALAAASRYPFWVQRTVGMRTTSVLAEAYKAAGGQLSRQEEEGLREYQRVRAQRAQQAAGAAGAAAADAAQAYEVTPEDMEASDLKGEYPAMQWQLQQPANCEYEASMKMWDAVARFACPHLAAEMERKRDHMGVPSSPAEEPSAEADGRLMQAVAREAGGGGEPDLEAARRQAELMVRAEGGDRQAQMMVMMDVSVPGVFPGLL
ncbi:hypothetical protein ABPG75_006072 [Micractinium tetrahymenae]